MQRDGASGAVLDRRMFLEAIASAGAGLSLRGYAQEPAPARSREAAATRKLALQVNGKPHEVVVDARATLLDTLRDHLHLTGAKKGCDRGQCGACTVIADGRRINSCLALAVLYDGVQITTVEGLASNDALSPLQAAFLDADAFQCGYCTPGQLCSGTAMLQELRAGAPSAVTPRGATPQLSDAEIRERMSGNICRCGAYPKIVAAIRTAGQA